MSRPHALVLPFPMQGHITPLMQLAQHLASHGFLITFVISHHSHARMLQACDESSHSLSYPGINMVSLSDGLPLEEQRTIDNLMRSMPLLMPPLLEQLISDINQTSSPPITCIIVDTYMDWALPIVEQASIPAVFAFYVSGVAQLSMFCSAPFLISSGQLTPDGLPKDLEAKVTGLPGLLDMPITDLHWLMDGNTDMSKNVFIRVTTMFENVKKLRAILVNSFYELESESIDALLQQGIKIVPVGPLLLLDSIHDPCYNVPSTVLSIEDKGCLDWLEGKPECSVLYIAFGSLAQLNIEELHELALGIEASQQIFLWVLRHDLMIGGKPACLPEGFLDRTKDRAYFTSWAPQALVLSHASIGAYLTHCGWNSTMESISMGVPMLTLPYFADNKSQSHQVVHEWKVGMPLKKNNNDALLQQEVEKLVRLILNGKEGKEIRERVRKLKDKAKLAIKRDFGLSYSNIQEIIQVSSLRLKS